MNTSANKQAPVTTRMNLAHPLVPKLNFAKMMSLKLANKSNNQADLSLGALSQREEPRTLDLAPSSSF